MRRRKQVSCVGGFGIRLTLSDNSWLRGPYIPPCPMPPGVGIIIR